MAEVIFSSWNNKVIDNRGVSQEQRKKPETLPKLPEQFAGKEIAAFMGWNGVIIKSDRVDVVDITRAYLEQVQGFPCLLRLPGRARGHLQLNRNRIRGHGCTQPFNTAMLTGSPGVK